MKRGLLVLVLMLVLAGCVKHYWSRPGASPDDFVKDSRECTRSTAVPTTPNKDYGIVNPEYYKACMRGHGWVRAQQLEPVQPGWYRGIEREDLVKLDTVPLPSGQSPPAPTPPPVR
jgi:hypothetical protein